MYTSYELWLNFVIASRLLKHYSAMPDNVACARFIHTFQSLETTPLPQALDAFHHRHAEGSGGKDAGQVKF